jgi:hypothetical protein
MATKYDFFNDATVPNNAIYWVQAYGASLPGDADYQDSVAGPGVTIHYSFKEAGVSPDGEAATVLTPDEKAQIVDAVTKIQQYANVTFVATDVASADLLFAAAAASTDGATGKTFPRISNPATLNPTEVWAYGSAVDTGNNPYIYKHELLHALGLDHSTTVFGNNTNPIPDDQITGTTLFGHWQAGFHNDYELFDIAALQYFYGPSPTQRAGNDTYTLNPAVFDPNSPQAGWPLLWDGGGFDTLDYSAFAVPVNISLVPGELSRINGAAGHILEAGVFSINYRTVIEAVFGGSGNDTLKGNDADNTIKGGLGDDAIDGGNGIDTAVFSGARAAYSITYVGGNLQIAGPDGTDSLRNVELLQFADQTIDTPRRASSAFYDFNGDGKNDLFFANNTNHGVAEWQMNGTTVTASPQIGTVAAGWHFAGAGDFNADHKTDLLFINDTTHGIAEWQMNGSIVTASPQIGVIAAGWHFSDTGDYNGDGKTDLLFQNDTTHGLAVWQMDGTTATSKPQIGTVNAAAGWNYVDKGDFNGDHKTDLLFINDTTKGVAIWQMNGTTVTSSPQVGIMDNGFHFAETGDFNGDGKTDLLMLNDTSHAVQIWQMNGTTVTSKTTVGTISAATGWHFQDTGDFNGDGKTDLLFLNDTTHGVAIWQMNGNTVTSSPQIGTIAAGWHYSGLADTNGDHKTDILFANDTTHGIAVWQMDGTHVAANPQIGTVNAAADWHLVS